MPNTPNDSGHQPPTPPGTPPGAMPGYPDAPMPQFVNRPQLVHIVAKPGGIWRAITIVFGLLMIGGIFFFGIILGAMSAIYGPDAESAITIKTLRSGRGPDIAVIPVMGIIDITDAEFVRMAVDQVLKSSNYKAVILRVDSPGGGVTASDQIWYEFERLKKAGIPVVASYGTIAASGGYYISCGADYIMAEETCTTGSIGVIAQIFTMEDLMSKIGVKPVTLIATGSPEKSVANDLFRNWNDNDREKVLTLLNNAYDIFNKRVRTGRASVISDPAMIDQLATGAVFTAQQALDNGLIDGIGYIDQAIAQAETLGSIPANTANVVILKQASPFFSSNGLFLSARKPSPLLDAQAIRRLANDLASPRMMYLMH